METCSSSPAANQDVTNDEPLRLLIDVDFAAVCRFCLHGATASNLLAPMFVLAGRYRRYVPGIESLSLAEIVHRCLGLSVAAADALPPNVCDRCEAQLADVYRFRQRAHGNVATLLDIVEQRQRRRRQKTTPGDSSECDRNQLISHHAVADQPDVEREVNQKPIIIDLKSIDDDDHADYADEADQAAEDDDCRQQVTIVESSDDVKDAEPLASDYNQLNIDITTTGVVDSVSKSILIPTADDGHGHDTNDDLLRCPHCANGYRTQLGLDRHVKTTHSRRSPPRDVRAVM